MPQLTLKASTLFPILLVALIFFARPSHAFGAGNIGSTSKIEGQNWRHGDIEDTLLTLLTARVMGGKKFSKLDVKRVYFGNWLRDYSQAVDVGTVKYVSADAIRLLLWVLGFMSFGYGTGEFEVTKERLGCYRPEEHIDNPKDYADNMDARQYDRRLRGPVDERRELGIDERTGMKNYIASEDLGITTSAALVRNLFGQAIDLGRRYRDSDDKRDFYEALRLLGTACHCLEDFSAHSNYTELALIEMGERDIFPHVGRRTQMEIRGARHPVFPIVTGTFGGVDFLHSVMGEFSDKATQSELEELEGAIGHAKNSDTSMLKDILSKIPPGVFGSDTDQASKADELQANAAASQMQNMHITPKEPEEFTKQIQQIMKEVYPIIEFHDNIMQGISSAIDRIPILPELIEQLQDQVNLFVFSLLAPYIMPVISQVKTELHTGSSEVIKSSQDHQMAVFSNDHDTDPTHSMLSKDHFSNVLNEPAGKVASQVLKWVVPQIVECWDNDDVDIARTLDRIVNGVLHHPALREYGDDGASDGRMLMFQVVEQWWGEKGERERDELREKLSREGVQNFRNHKPGVHDKGHGCGKPLGLPTRDTYLSSGATGGKNSGAGDLLGGIAGALASGSQGSGGFGGSQKQDVVSDKVSEAVGGGAIGSIVGGFASNILGNSFSDDKRAERKTHQSSGYGEDGSYSSGVTQTGHRPGGYGGQEERYGQAQVSSTQYPSGGHREEYQRYEQDGRSGSTGYGFQQSTESRTYGDSYEQRTERRYERPGGSWDSEVQTQRLDSSGRSHGHSESYHGSSRRSNKSDDDDDDDDSDDDDDYEKKQRKREKKEQKRLKKLREKEEKYGSRRDSDDEDNYGRSHGREDSYGRSSGRGDEYGRSSGRDDDYGRSSRREADNYPSRQPAYGEEQSYSSGYGRQEQSYSQSSRYEQTSSSGYGGDFQYSSGGYGSSNSGYGRGGESYGGESGGYGSSSGYGNDSYGSSGRNEGYGRSSGYGDNDSSMPGSFGGDGSYDNDRRRDDGRSGYGNSGYGESQGYDGSGGYGESGGYGGGGYGSRY